MDSTGEFMVVERYPCNNRPRRVIDISKPTEGAIYFLSQGASWHQRTQEILEGEEIVVPEHFRTRARVSGRVVLSGGTELSLDRSNGVRALSIPDCKLGEQSGSTAKR